MTHPAKPPREVLVCFYNGHPVKAYDLDEQDTAEVYPQDEISRFIEYSAYEKLERELADCKAELKKRNQPGKVFVNRYLYDQAIAMAERLAGILKKAQNIVVEDECEECGTFKGARYEIKPIVDALTEYAAWKAGGGNK